MIVLLLFVNAVDLFVVFFGLALDQGQFVLEVLVLLYVNADESCLRTLRAGAGPVPGTSRRNVCLPIQPVKGNDHGGPVAEVLGDDPMVALVASQPREILEATGPVRP